ncbi:MAG: hypothetical protein WBH68_03325 [Erysipelotrichaceae bacterium]|nr:hypothetical protein [Bacillota bacterium]NLP22351.1 hypothetical protein [Erysipelotrichaceae bacterium]
MAKIVKRKKRRVRFQSLTLVFFIFSGFLYLLSSLFLRSYNNSLSLKKQTILSEIAALELENEAIEVVIQNLSTRDRVETIANDNGLTLNQNNIITITSGE